MTALGQRTLIQHLSNAESLGIMVREGIDLDVVPTDELRKVATWAVEYYHRGGREKAPSVEALKLEFGDLFNDHEIDLTEEPENTVEWAIDDLRGSYVHKRGVTFLQEMAVELANATTSEKPYVLSAAADELIGVSMTLENRSRNVDMRAETYGRILEYEGRVNRVGDLHGMSFGLNLVDDFTAGIHPGELAVVAAGPKVGKSWFMCKAALAEWERGRSPALYTLENSVDMMMDRILCIAAGIPPRDWQHGKCSEGQLVRAYTMLMEIQNSPNPLWVLQPDRGRRSVEYIVRDAQTRGADSLLIDQLSHIEVDEGDLRRQRHEQINNLTATLRLMISSVRDPMPCLLAHQISREGVKAAEKSGRLEMYHLAEAAGVERTSDWVFGLYQSIDQRGAEALFQIMGARREDIASWVLAWDITQMHIRTKHQYQLGE